MTDTQPNWQPISMLPTIAQLIKENLEESLIQFESFKEAEHRPQVFTDEIINRALKLYRAQLDDHWLFERQLEIWSNDALTIDQRLQVDYLKGHLPKIKETYQAILSLLDKMKDFTLDKMMAMDDFELGLKILAGEMPNSFKI
jgi:hypothetical protein